MKGPEARRPWVRATLSALLWALFGDVALAAGGGEWTFMVSGDSRNCGNVVMPSIARDAREHSAKFYWHLGDLRWITDIDEDFAASHDGVSKDAYRLAAWDDFVDNQIAPFAGVPFFLGIGNHETKQPKTRAQFVSKFSDWLDAPLLHAQRLQDDAQDLQPHTYYHWRQQGIEFLYLDNGSDDQFDARQLTWLTRILGMASTDDSVRAVVVGMHKAMPDSIADGHSMSESSVGRKSGRRVYHQLLELQKQKPVYLLASHSHYYMAGIYDTTYWRSEGGVLPGWIVGTAGAKRYDLPAELHGNKDHRAHVYGYLVGTVKPAGSADPVSFQFREITQVDVPNDIVAKYGTALVRTCYAKNP